MQRRLSIAVAGLVLATAACSAPGATPGAAATSSNVREQALRWTQCMREHGVPMLDPDSNGDPRGADGGKGSVEATVVDAAQRACEPYRPVLSGPEADARLRIARDYSRCMREHGVEDFPDPDGDGRVTLPDEITDPDFDAAREACDAQQRRR